MPLHTDRLLLRLSRGRKRGSFPEYKRLFIQEIIKRIINRLNISNYEQTTTFENIKRKKSFLCVGLDTDIKKIPEHLLKEEDPIFAFNKAIIDATADLCIAYKPNLAFYESMGVKGGSLLKRL